MKTNRSQYSIFVGAFCALVVASLTVSTVKAAAPEKKPSPNFDLSANYSFSSSGEVERRLRRGEVEVHHADIEAGMTFPLFEGWRVRSGVFASRTDLEHTRGVPLPDELEAMGLSLRATKTFGEAASGDWRATLMVRPGVFSDGAGSLSSGFNAPGMLGMGQRISPTLSWETGVRFDLKSQHPVLPMIGVRWGFRPDWELAVGFPRTEVTCKLTPDWTLKGGLRFQGGTYHVESVRAPGRGGTDLEYRELRIGGGFEWKINDTFSMNFDGGLVVDRKFDYPDRDVELQGDSAAYVAIRTSARF